MSESRDHNGPRDAVKAFVDSASFPMEFEAASRLHGGGFMPHHGRAYASETPAGTVYREIDVLADLMDTRTPWLAMSAVVECKRLKNPWVVVRGDNETRPGLWPITSGGPVRADPSEIADAVREALELEPPLSFALTQLTGPKEVREKRSDRDPAWDALRQTLSAARGASTLRPDERRIYHPVLVVAGELWEYQYGREVRRLDEARIVSWGADGPWGTVVDVVTWARFSREYILQLRESLVEMSNRLTLIDARAK